MRISDFTESAQVVHAVDRLQEAWQDKVVSDVVDGQGHQYIDLVMEGGGVLGIALVGYTYALESVGLRVRSVGGASAGAINALLFAAVDVPGEAKSEKLLEILSALDMFSLVDGDSDARDFVEALVEGAGPIKLGFKAAQVIDNLREDFGLNPGDEFLRWLTANLAALGISTEQELRERMQTMPEGLRRRDGEPVQPAKFTPSLKLVAADVTTETKVVFPEMASLYFKHPPGVNPALFVRASMSIPGFFHPLRIRDLPRGRKAARDWSRYAGYDGDVPEEVLFVDGGILSNFPINLFHGSGVPRMPTFGVKLGVDRTSPREIEKSFQFLGAVFDTARHGADYDFIARHPDYRHLVQSIRTGAHNWLNFFMSDDDKIDLFARGVTAGVDFLSTFDWEQYKGVRKKLAGL